MEKFIFTIDNESQYFVSENRVIYWKNVFQKFFDVEKMFSQQGEGVGNFIPPYSVAEKTSKSVKILPMGILTKTRKTRLSIVKRFLPKFSKKNTYLWGF